MSNNKKYYFYSSNQLTIEQILSIVNRDYPSQIINYKQYNDEYIELSLLNNNSTIRFYSSDYCDDLDMNLTPYTFELHGDLTILLILFRELGILFYDDGYSTEVEYLDEIMDNKHYDAILRKYIVDCMIHYEIIKSENDINKKLYNNKHTFCNEYVYDEAKYKQINRITMKLRKKRINLIIEKIKEFIKNIFKTKKRG